jgi:hypothetical protein
MNWYRNTNVSEEGSSSTSKILGARFDVLKEVKIKVIFWIYSSNFVSGFHIFMETSGLYAPIFYTLQILSRGKITYKDFLFFHLVDIHNKLSALI